MTRDESGTLRAVADRELPIGGETFVDVLQLHRMEAVQGLEAGQSLGFVLRRGDGRKIVFERSDDRNDDSVE